MEPVLKLIEEDIERTFLVMVWRSRERPEDLLDGSSVGSEVPRIQHAHVSRPT